MGIHRTGRLIANCSIIIPNDDVECLACVRVYLQGCVCVCGDRGGSARGNHGRRKISARGKIWAVSDEEGTLWR